MSHEEQETTTWVRHAGEIELVEIDGVLVEVGEIGGSVKVYATLPGGDLTQCIAFDHAEDAGAFARAVLEAADALDDEQK